MNEDLLISLHRKLQGVVGRAGIRPVARRVFRRLVKARYGIGGLTTSRRNGRLWKLDLEVALRGEFQEFGTVEHAFD